MEATSSFISGILQYVRIAFMDIGFLDILDILVVAVILYGVLAIVFKTGASRIAKAILAILVLTGLSSLIGMDTLHFILKNTIELGVLALIIVFQPELRRVLETIGSRSILELFEPKKTEDETMQVLKTAVKTCEALAADRIGALIVFEMDTRLDSYFNQGTRLDAMVSEEMLKNIFFPKAALHDGAVIIREDRIVAAGCVLPLSDNPNLSRELGTRHRAGVGITEKTDAVVLIVSEETGMVSFAENGFLRRYRLDGPEADALDADGLHPRDELMRRLRITFRLTADEKDRSLAAFGSRLRSGTFKVRKDDESETKNKI